VTEGVTEQVSEGAEEGEGEGEGNVVGVREDKEGVGASPMKMLSKDVTEGEAAVRLLTSMTGKRLCFSAAPFGCIVIAKGAEMAAATTIKAIMASQMSNVRFDRGSSSLDAPKEYFG